MFGSRISEEDRDETSHYHHYCRSCFLQHVCPTSCACRAGTGKPSTPPGAWPSRWLGRNGQRGRASESLHCADGRGRRVQDESERPSLDLAGEPILWVLEASG